MDLRVVTRVVRSSTACLAIAAYCMWSPLWAARAEGETAQCSEEVFNVSQEMQQKYGLNVAQPTAAVANEPVNPVPGSNIRFFTMITNFTDETPYVKRATFKAVNFMNSTGIQLHLAKRVMEVCSSTSKVVFGFAASGYSIGYFRMPSENIREGIAIECGRNAGYNELKWGYFYSC